MHNVLEGLKSTCTSEMGAKAKKGVKVSVFIFLTSYICETPASKSI